MDKADTAALFSQMAVDERRLRERIASILKTQSQVTLPEVLERFPAEEGLAEIVTYLSLAPVISDAHSDSVRNRHADHDVTVVLSRAVSTK